MMQEIYMCTGCLYILPVLGWILFSARPMPMCLLSSNGKRTSTFNTCCPRRIVCNKCVSLCSVSMRISFRHFSGGSILISFAALGTTREVLPLLCLWEGSQTLPFRTLFLQNPGCVIELLERQRFDVRG